jgi:hypothetical protein
MLLLKLLEALNLAALRILHFYFHGNSISKMWVYGPLKWHFHNVFWLQKNFVFSI